MLVVDISRDFYNRLKRSSQRVLVVAHHDVDAVCASQILLRLFQCDEIMHSMVSVRNKAELRNVIDEFRGKVKFVVLLNCGGTIDLDEELGFDEDQIVFVADNHRPIQHSNFYSESQVQILCRLDSDDINDVPSHAEIFRDESSDEEPEESDEEAANEKRKKRKRYDDEYFAKKEEKRKWMENRRQILFDYYEFSYYGSSTAVLMFELAWKMTKDTNELLWMAVVGMSEMLLNGKIGRDSYALELARMQPHVLRLNPLIPNGVTSADNGDASRKKGYCRGMHITVEEELTLPLYQHWSLWDSFRYSRSVACRFKLWSSQGERGLLGFLAELGFPLVEVKQSYSNMNMQLRKELRPALEEKAEKYKLKDLSLTTFLARFGMKYEFSALDFALALQALMDPPYDPTRGRSDNFFRALRALSKSSMSHVLEGINGAKQQLACVFRLTQVLLDMQCVTVLGPFLHVVVTEGCADARSLWCPSWFHLLARFLLEANAASTRNKKSRVWPLVVALPDPQSIEHQYILGIPPLAQESSRNLFGKAFEQAINRTKVTAFQDTFDTAIIHLRKADSTRFLDALVHLLEN